MIALLGLYLLSFWSCRPGERDLAHLVLYAGAPTANLLGTVLFLIGDGLYAGVRHKTTKAALASLFGTYFVVLLLASLLPTGALGTWRLPSGTPVLGTVAGLVLVGFVFACIGVLALIESARDLRRNVF